MGVTGTISSVMGWCNDCLHLRATITNVAIGTLCLCYFGPAMLAHGLLYPLFRLVFGTLYPAYASYKAVRAKNVKEYVKWMMYWIVFALFTCAETFTDVFLSFWFPFYYEFKVILVLWLLSPATKGSSILYRKFVHPMLTKREQEIDEYIARAKDQSYHTVLALGTKGVNYATSVIMQTAIKNIPILSAPALLAPAMGGAAPAGKRRHVKTEQPAPMDERDCQLPVDAFSDEEELDPYYLAEPAQEKPSRAEPDQASLRLRKSKRTRKTVKHIAEDNGVDLDLTE